eukprot:5600988-Amphidinium_carterae.2
MDGRSLMISRAQTSQASMLKVVPCSASDMQTQRKTNNRRGISKVGIDRRHAAQGGCCQGLRFGFRDPALLDSESWHAIEISANKPIGDYKQVFFGWSGNT